MRAAVVGTGWGRVHIAALQRLDVEVVAVCGTDLIRTEHVARECGVAQAVIDVDRLPGLGLDLITIAAPTAIHADLVARLGPTPLLCEKPAVGMETPVADVPQPSGPVWVNYAFPFLDVVAQADGVLASLVGKRAGGVNGAESFNASLGGDSDGLGVAEFRRPATEPSYATNPPAAAMPGSAVSVDVESWYDLDGLVAARRSGWQWLIDVSSHPWSWVMARFGAPMLDVRGELGNDGGARLAYQSETGATVSVRAAPAPGFNGLRHGITVNVAGHTVRIGGAFHVGSDWVFDPLQLDGRPLANSQQDGDASGADPWFLANVAAFSAVVQWVRGDTSGPAPYTWKQALALDACAQQAARMNPAGR